jgi:hypothetical protein
VEAGTTALAVIPRPASGASSKTSEVLVDLRAGLDKPGRLRINTFFQGQLADAERQSLADDSAAERQKNYVNYIVQYYPNAKAAEPFTVRDDPSRNVVEVEESYELDPPFRTNRSGRLQLNLHPDEIYHYLRPLDSPVRTAPLAIEYPARVRQTIRALLPQKWSFDNETVSVSNPAFTYRSDVSYSETGNVPQLTVDYRYESLASFVDVAALGKYQADRKRAYDDTGYSLRPPPVRPRDYTTPGPLALAPLMTALLTLVLGCAAALLLLRWDPPPAPAQPGWPAGIRGWLLIPALAVALAPFALGIHLYLLSHSIDTRHWTHLHDTVPEPFRTWAPAILLALTAGGMVLLMIEALLMYLFFWRRSSAPQVFIAQQWLLAAYNGALLAASAAHVVGMMTNAWGLLEVTLEAAAFSAYMLLSKRVRATFVRRAAARAPRVDAAAA